MQLTPRLFIMLSINVQIIIGSWGAPDADVKSRDLKPLQVTYCARSFKWNQKKMMRSVQKPKSFKIDNNNIYDLLCLSLYIHISFLTNALLLL